MWVYKFFRCVQIARKVGDPDIPRPWSRYAQKKGERTSHNESLSGSEMFSITSSKTERKKKELNKTSEDVDPQLQEFLQVMQPRVNSKLWANDTLVATVSGNTDNTCTQYKEDRENSSSAKVELEKMDGVKNELSGAPKNSRNVAHDEVVSDMDYFKSRVKKDWSDSETSEDGDGNDEKKDGDDSFGGSSSDEDDQAADAIQKHSSMVLPDEPQRKSPLADTDNEKIDQGNLLSSLKNEKEETLQSDRLFVRNLPYTAT